MENAPDKTDAFADNGSPKDPAKPKKIWQIIRYPIGVILLGIIIYGKIMQKLYPSAVTYGNTAQIVSRKGAKIFKSLGERVDGILLMRCCSNCGRETRYTV